jgi:mannosyl-oligosaccharide glucosidase
MWAEPASQEFDVRHEARHEHNLAKIGWQQHDLRRYGRQEILDHGLRISAAFLKVKSTGRSSGGTSVARDPGQGYGGAWSLQVNASEAEDGALARAGGFANLYWYFGDLAASSGELELDNLEVMGPPSIDVRLL